MPKFIKLSLMFLMAVLFSFGIITPITKKEAKAAPKPASASTWDVFIDENNDVCIVTNDKKKTSSIFYRTEGFTISRGKFKPSMKQLANGAATEYFFRALNASATETYTIGGREVNCFKYPFASIKAGMSGAWAAEIDEVMEYGGTAYIRFDCMMYVYHGAARAKGPFMGHPPVNPDESLYQNPAAIQAAEPWSAGANTGLKSHYHRWLPITKGKPPEEEPEWYDWHVTQQSGSGPGSATGSSMTYAGDYSGAPMFAGGNANLEGYDAGLGIPSTKTVSAYAEASPWHGSLDVWARMTTKQYNIRHLYKWTPVPFTEESGVDSLQHALDQLWEKEPEIRGELEGLLDNESNKVGEIPHDTPNEHVQHHWIRVMWMYDDGSAFRETESGSEFPGEPAEGSGATVPESSDHQHTPKKPWVPQWHCGVRWDKWEKNAKGEMVNNGGEMTWDNPSKAKPAPEGATNVVQLYKEGKVMYTQWKLTCIVNREYWDEKYKGTEDGFIQTYVAFEYLDPYKTKFYDLDSVTLYNDTYGSQTLGATIDSYMDSGKADIKNRRLKTFDEVLDGGKTMLTAADIDSEDYMKLSEEKSRRFGGEQTNRPPELTDYTTQVTKLERKIHDETFSMNDYCQVKNPVDSGPADGIYLGNKDMKWRATDRNANAGVIKGCDFRDGRWMGYESLGTHAELIGLKFCNKEYEKPMGEASRIKSKFWMYCTHSAGGNKANANAYITQNEGKVAGKNQAWERLGSSTSAIEPTIRNGAHESDISTRYVPEMIDPPLTSMTIQFAKVLDGHLYGGGGGSHGFSIWGGCMGSEEGPDVADFDEGSGFSNLHQEPGPGSDASINYGDVSFIVDPVQIHTPIMTPGTIITVDDHGNKKQVDKAHSEGNSQLINDTSKNTTSQLRLDKYYFIRWQDLSEIGKTHRDAPTSPEGPGETGGYWTETDSPATAGLEEDEFTKNKYMKFPFEVFYDGRFYKANQWILIKSPRKYGPDGGVSETDDGYLRDPNPTIHANGSFSSQNHWVYTPIYIPTWAKEGLFEAIDNPDPYHPADLTTCAQLKVDAINVVTKEGKNMSDQIQELANTYYNVNVSQYADGAAYVATFNLPVQSSGWIYGFTITGTSDKDIYGYQGEDELTTTQVTQDYDYSFAKFWQDKKAGIKNRLGYQSVRYLKDGTIAHSDDELVYPLNTIVPQLSRAGIVQWKYRNTIALVGAWEDSGGTLHYGKSNYWKYMGTVPKGNIFSFTLKTIANMWNFNEKDSIKITPTFKYQKYNDTDHEWIYRENKDLKVYYSDNGQEFIPYGSAKDKGHVQKVNLGNPQFEESYYDGDDTTAKTFGDWLDYNVYTYDKRHKLLTNGSMTLDQFKYAIKSDIDQIGSKSLTPQMWLTQKVDAYCLSNITIPERLRLLSGEADQIEVNNYKDGYDQTNPGFRTYKDMAGGNYGKEYSAAYNADNTMTLTGSSPKLTYKYTDASGAEQPPVTIDISMDDKFRHSIQSWYCQYYIPSDLYVVDLKTHPEFRDFSDPDSPYHHDYESNGNGAVYGYQLGDADDNNPYWDYLEYYATKEYRDGDGLTDDEPIFIPNGFLTVNFDIIAVKDGIPHLVYKGTNTDGWKIEGYQKIPPNIKPPVKGKTEDGVPTDTGDVIVVDLSKKFSDRFRAGIYNIN